MEAVIVGGSIGNGAVEGFEAAVDRVRGAGRVSLSPLDHSDASGNLLGFYRTNYITGATVSLAANAPIVSVRWTMNSVVYVLLRVTAVPEVLTPITAATSMDLEVIAARLFTASDSAGTATPPNKLRSLFSNSQVGDSRVATTTTLTAGTRTLDGSGFGYAAWQTLNAPTLGATANTAIAVGAGEMISKDLYKYEAIGSHPPVFGFNEGFIVRNSVAGPVTGTVRWTITIEHAELAAF